MLKWGGVSQVDSLRWHCGRRALRRRPTQEQPEASGRRRRWRLSTTSRRGSGGHADGKTADVKASTKDRPQTAAPRTLSEMRIVPDQRVSAESAVCLAAVCRSSSLACEHPSAAATPDGHRPTRAANMNMTRKETGARESRADAGSGSSECGPGMTPRAKPWDEASHAPQGINAGSPNRVIAVRPTSGAAASREHRQRRSTRSRWTKGREARHRPSGAFGSAGGENRGGSKSQENRSGRSE
jgi:hypothetical protein